jgi:hypothetical protein
MRTTLLALGMTLLAGSVLGQPPIETIAGALPASRTVYLDDAAALAELKATNPDHYARARGIMDAANHLCRPGPPNVHFARYQARDIACARYQVFTSLPPKRRLSFKLDDTLYIAMVVLTDHPAHVEPAR